MAPSTFASAAAGSNSSIPSSRPEGTNEWARRANGATQTFRRPSLATSYSNSNINATPTSNHQRESSGEALPARYVPPHRNGIAGDARYSKDQLLGLVKSQIDAGSLQRDSLTNLTVGGWEPDQVNGLHDGGSGWQRRDDSRGEILGSDAFWDVEGSVMPRGLIDLTEEEKDVFSSSVNSPLKQMNANNRDVSGKEGPLRRISVSNNPNSPGGFSLNSPTAARSGGRRREASESYPFPSQSLASPKPRDDLRTTSPPPALRRRTTDLKEAIMEGKGGQEGFTGLDTGENKQFPGAASRIATTNPLSAGIGGPSSPWGGVQQSPGFAPMGAFGAFGAGNVASTPTEKRPGLGAGRAESRFKGLMSKESNDEIGKASKDKAPSKPEGSNWRSAWPETGRSGIDRDLEGPTGSAALGGGEEINPPSLRGLQNLGTPQRPDNRDDFGFSAFGMTPDTGLKGLMHDHQHGQHLRGPNHMTEAMSPTNTNPYQSPHQDEGDDVDTDSSELHNIPLRGLGGLIGDDLGQMPANFGGGFPTFGQAPGDRSQTSSTGPRPGFPGLSGLGALPGLSGNSAWGGLPPSAGTPIRDRAAHGGLSDHPFGSGVDLQSPSLAGLGSSNFFGMNQSAAPGAGRGVSRIGSLFQQSGQDMSRGFESQRATQEDDKSTALPHAPLGEDNEAVNALTQSIDDDSKTGGDASSGSLGGQFGASQTQSSHATQPNQQSQSGGTSNSIQPPAAQQRTMVMPDRMRWIYRDPQGNTQGPWSGLEMHDWYKAGFFSPELLVKKFEDADYEPLAQLIRRIGNSREPFLVPQIGIPHGTAQTNWGSGPMATSTGQPPFAASFPSFGTTLTADQQNALERRKQEEQYLMARQKEHLAQQQMAQRLQFQHPHGGMMPHPLQHHASAQSLQSQQSFGSVGSTHGYQATQMATPTQGHQFPGFPGNNNSGMNQTRGFGAVGGGTNPAMGAGLDPLSHIREEGLSTEVEKLNIDQQGAQGGQTGSIFSQQGRTQQDVQNLQQQVNMMMEDRANLEAEQAQYDATRSQAQDDSISNDRLHEFERLQQGDLQDDMMEVSQQQSHYERMQREVREAQRTSAQHFQQTPTKEPRSLTEQVQQAVSAQQSPNAWGKVDPALPQPFPPAPSQSPLPAPAAQRNRSHVADALHAESHSGSQSPSIEPPSASVAPWAKEPAEAPRGPSLREIQEIEAKNAAKAEAIAAEVRKAAMEREAVVQAAAAAAAAAATPTVGLPLSSTWASTGAASPTISGPGSAWAKAAKPAPSAANAKSMAQIQKEEEARKKRLVAAAQAQQQAATLAGAVAQAQGKRYAELASKVAATSPGGSPAVTQQGNAAWTTVGASGKVKAPVTTTPGPVRVPSNAAAPIPAVVAKKPAPIRSVTNPGGASAVNAQEEFKRWAAGELRGDLNKGVNADEFISNLLAFPNELDLVTEAVHSVSTTIDSRHYAEEFLRRRKQADRGVFEPFSSGGASSPAIAEAKNGSAGGWSEVAKKGGAKVDPNVKEELAAFKVVAAKKKAGKR